MFDKFSRSWALIKASAAVLRSDKELLVFPLLSSLAALLVAATFIVPAFGLGWLEALGDGASPVMLLFGFLFYLAQYFVIFFFNSALVGAAMIRLDGGDPTVADGLRIASGKLGAILGYAAIAATVGLLLRALEERAGFLGRIAVGLVGLAWTVATYLAVPILVARDVGPIEAVKESAALLKRSWGENVIGNAGIGLVFGLLSVVTIVLGAGLAIVAAANGFVALAIALGVLTVLAAIVLGLVQAALSGVYSAALYRYAVDGQAPVGFDGEALRLAFQPKR